MPRHVLADDARICCRDRRFVDDGSLRHHQDAIRQFEQFVEILRHQQHGGAGVARLHDSRADIGDRPKIQAEAGVGDNKHVDRACQLARQYGAQALRSGSSGIKRTLSACASSLVASYRSPLTVISPASRWRWPASTSRNSFWPLPEMPAMPTISPARTVSPAMVIDFSPLRSSALMPVAVNISGASAWTGWRTSSVAIFWSPIIIAAIAW